MCEGGGKMGKLPSKTKIIGENIRNIRLFKGITAREVAKHCRISAGHYQMLESGRRRINVDHIFAIAEALGVPPEKLVNPDITTYSPSGRALPLVKIADLNTFSTCPDKDSVEKIANQICLCPPEATDERAFAVELKLDPKFWIPPEQRFGIVICVPSGIEDLPLTDYERDPTGMGGRAEQALIKVSGHPAYYSEVHKWRSRGETLLTLITHSPRRYVHLMVAPPGQEGSKPTVQWICRGVVHYPQIMVPLIIAPKRPRKEE